MSTRIYSAALYPRPQADGLSIEAITGTERSTPGNVCVCLCGGGSRALSAGMGQLRALAKLQSPNGRSLLSQVKALSTVSGGSWLGITFNFQSAVTEAEFLNLSQCDPGQLTTKDLESLPEGCIGARVNSDFSAGCIAVEALLYFLFTKTPADMLWQTVIGKHILKPYGLYDADRDQAPSRTFSDDEDSVTAILGLPEQSEDISASDFITLGAAGNPYSICNTAMFVEGATPRLDAYRYLAPVQSTPYFTGIVGAPGGTDANGASPGGGGVTSFAFDSELTTLGPTHVRICEERYWSLVDSVGASSAAFAEKLGNLFSTWSERPEELLQALEAHGDAVLERLASELAEDEHRTARLWLDAVRAADRDFDDADELFERLARHELQAGRLHDVLNTLGLDGIIPRYRYWPVTGPATGKIEPTEFADGGSLENTGVASALSYRDIDSLIACVNSTTLLTPLEPGKTTPPVQFDERTGVIETRIEVAAQIPPLFGYQKLSNGRYTPYCVDGQWNVDSANAWGAHNQVFEREHFADLLRGLWAAAGGSQRPAVYLQTLPVKANEWFGVPSRGAVKVLWVYTSTTSDWREALSDAGREALDAIDPFPDYDTMATELSPTEVNLLSSLTTWALEQHRAGLLELFEAGNADPAA